MAHSSYKKVSPSKNCVFSLFNTLVHTRMVTCGAMVTMSGMDPIHSQLGPETPL